MCLLFIAMKFTKEVLEVAAKNSNSVSGVMRYIGASQSGGSHIHIKNKLIQYGIDMSHFRDYRTFLKEAAKNRAKSIRKTPTQILTLEKRTFREKRILLHRALQEIGRECKCVDCGVSSMYNGKPIVLEIDHINEDWRDNRESNLAYRCPNCHSQK